MVMIIAIMGVAESNPTPILMDHSFPSTTTTTTTYARYGHLLHGMLGELESFVLDGVVKFLFQHLGEELPQAR
ncbi:hypothetical protein E2C01_032120 [Portunus trituberculatus]|uniref:Uncharacterized protein n=1 Tax=Portunus trituberculatus TaxID=210409 RepID=A0A5B7F035_PORTR|nr:hypothetical protein [Portunus trituberculatus]